MAARAPPSSAAGRPSSAAGSRPPRQTCWRCTRQPDATQAPAPVTLPPMSRDVIYLLLLSGLLVLPRALQRLKIPAPITSLLLRVGAMLLWGSDTHDPGG